MKKLVLILSLFSATLFADYYNMALKAYLHQDYLKAQKYFKLACLKEKDALGCFSYANMVKNTNKKDIYLQKACNLGLKKACN